MLQSVTVSLRVAAVWLIVHQVLVDSHQLPEPAQAARYTSRHHDTMRPPDTLETGAGTSTGAVVANEERQGVSDCATREGKSSNTQSTTLILLIVIKILRL